jgi:hypothetical protein
MHFRHSTVKASCYTNHLLNATWFQHMHLIASLSFFNHSHSTGACIEAQIQHSIVHIEHSIVQANHSLPLQSARHSNLHRGSQHERHKKAMNVLPVAQPCWSSKGGVERDAWLRHQQTAATKPAHQLPCATPVSVGSHWEATGHPAMLLSQTGRRYACDRSELGATV